MSIFNKVFGRKIKEARQPFISTVTQRFSATGQGNETTYLNEYKNWVYACVTARAEEVGNIQLKLMKDGEEVEKHDIIDLINKVNPTMTKYDLLGATQAYLDLTGNAYWYLARDKEGQGAIQEIYILRPDKMTVIANKENPLEVEGYIYRTDTRTQVPFNKNEILHFKNFNPLGNYPYPHKGMGIVQASYFAIDTDNDARTWNSSFFKKSARPDGILYQEGEGAASPEEHKRLQDEWAETFQGAENSHKVAILSGGLKWQEVTRTQKDMDFLGQRTFSRDEILAMFRVPKSIIGITDDVNRANADASIYVFALRTIKPLMQRMVDTLNEFLIPEFGDEGYYLDFVSPVPEDRAAKVAEFSAGINKWLSRNEIRAYEGLPPTENGDQFMGGFADVPVDTVKPKAIKNAKPSKKEIKANKRIEDFIAKLPEVKTVKTISEEAKKAYLTNWKSQIDVNAGGLKKKLVKYFKEQEKKVQENLKEEMKGLEAKEFKLKSLSDVLFDEEDEISAGISLITPFIESYLKQSGGQASELVGGTFDMTNPAIKKFIEQRAEYFATTVNDTTGKAIMDSLKEGTDAGETLNDLSKRISDIYDIAMDYRTDVIARTEVSASANEGAKQAYLQAGVEKWQWAVVDPQDEDCKANDGQIVAIGDSFNDGSIQPPDPHPNCMCTTIAIF